MRYTIYKTLFLCLAGVCLYGVVQAQRAVSLDSLPLFYGTADETGGSYAPPILKTKGRVTHIAANADGSISIAAFRQYVGYLDASPTKGLPMSPNALPGLVQYRYEPATGLQQVSAGIFNLNGGQSV